MQNAFRLTERLSVVPGLRYEHIRQHRTDLFANAARQESEFDAFAPGLGLTYALRAGTLAYANATRSFRPPSFGDTFNPATSASSFDLDSSSAWTYELGIRANPWAWLLADAGGYYTDFEDQVVVSAGTAANFDTESYGFEGTLQLGLVGLARTLRTGDPRGDGDHELYLLGGATLVRSRFRSGAFAGNDLPYVPEQTFTFGLLYEYRDALSLALQGRHVGARFTDNLETVQENAVGTIGRLGAYTVLDLKLRWQTAERVAISAGVNNLLDEAYATQRRTGSQKGLFPGPTRAFYVSTTLAF